MRLLFIRLRWILLGLSLILAGCGSRDVVGLEVDGPVGGHLWLAMGGEVTELDGLEGRFADGEVVRYRVMSRSVRIGGRIRSFVLVGGGGAGGIRVCGLDVSGARGLETLVCDGQELDTLDLSRNAGLVSVSLSGNPLRFLDLRGCGLLARLEVSGTRLERLDVSHCARLSELVVDGARLRDLQVRGCGQLVRLECGGNRLRSLDLSGLSALRVLLCGGNALDTLVLDGVGALSVLNCSSNGLGGVDLSPTPLLRELWCQENRIDSEGMERLVGSLPMVRDRMGRLVLLGVGSDREGNVSSEIVESLARLKGWEVYEMVSNAE